VRALRAVRIAGTGSFVPPRVVTNDDLAALMDTSDEWIRQRTGIEERRWVDEGTGPADLAFEASKRALEAAGLAPECLGAILVPTLTAEHDVPGTSSFLQDRLGLAGCAAADVRAQCTGFLYALQWGWLQVAAGICDHVLVCGVEVHSTGLDVSTRGRDVAVLFGDGAGAVVLSPAGEGEGRILSVHVHTEGRYAKKLWVEVPGSVYHPRISAEHLAEGRHYPVMEGRFVFKHAVTRMPEAVREALDANALTIEDVDLFLFHQANLRIIEAVGTALQLDPARTPTNIQRYGNTSAASLPLLLDECVRSGRLRPGSLVSLAGFGSGFTWGSALFRL
jgi:3-oxoacyl-[acyl-carrier-protein] synthase-3